MSLDTLTAPLPLRRDAPPLLLALESLGAEDRLLVRCSGALDLATTEQLEHEILGLAARGCTEITLDLTRLGFIDCCGLQTLTNLNLEAAAEGWSFRLAYGNGPVQRLLELTRTAGRFARAT
jgi:anti-anti-sigma factor